MTRLGVAVLLALGTLVLLAFREMVSREYDTWAGWLARAICRLAGRLHRAMGEEWWADLVQVQAERGGSGLGFAATTFLSGLRFAVTAATRRVTRRRSSLRTESETDLDLQSQDTVSELQQPVPTVALSDPPFVSNRPESRRRAIGEFGRRLREARRQAGISQQDLGERSGLHRVYVGHLERGESSPSLYNILRLAHALDVDPSELLRDLKP